MKKTRSTKHALLMSALALLLCVSMFVGSTFAWFTESITSDRNIIQSGNLDVELWFSTWDAENDTWSDYAKVDKDTKVFKDGALFEPGYTEVVRFKVENLGSLALKYNLTATVYNEVAGVNVDDEKFNLSNYIYVGRIDNPGDTLTRKEAAEAATTPLTAGFALSQAQKLEVKDPADTTKGVNEFALVLCMPETVDNVANHKTSDDLSMPDKYQPKIELGVALVATQFVNESDSFGDDYDENAAFSIWNGTVPTEMPETLVIDGDTQIVHVKDAAAFAYLSSLSANWRSLYTDGNGAEYSNYAKGAGANYYYSSKWTVSLEADIDLGNYAITPVNIVFGESTGNSAFKGNNHVIRNINTTTGLFANGARADYYDLTLENVTATNGALAGSVASTVKNVTVKNATISGTEYVGGLVGKTYGTVTRCTVVDSSVIATGKEAGGLIGYAETNSKGSDISGNTVQNVSVYANNRAAGLVAQPNVNIKVYNNIVDTVTIGVADTSTYQPGAVASNALAPENVYDNTVKNADIFTDAVAANDDAALDSAIASGAKTVFLDSAEYSLPTLAGKDGTTIIGTEGTVFGGAAASNGFGGNFGTNTTIKNVTFSGSETGARWTYAQGGTIVFENCAFLGNNRGGFHIDQGHGATLIFNNCVLSGFNAFAGDLEKVVLNGCTLPNNGKYNGLNMYCDLELNNCKFEFTGVGSEFVDFEAAGQTLTINNCTATMNGVAMNLADKLGGTYISQTTITIDGVSVVK